MHFGELLDGVQKVRWVSYIVSTLIVHTTSGPSSDHISKSQAYSSVKWKFVLQRGFPRFIHP